VLREKVEHDSLHVSVDANRLKAHVDQESPLTFGADGASGYSLRRAHAHNLAGMAQDVIWLLRGREGDQRSELDVEWVARDECHEPGAGRLDPRTGAWSVQLDARVAGRLDEARLRAALAATLGCDGLERDPLDVVACPDDAALDAARARLQRIAVPPDRSPPLHACLAHHGAGDVLMLSLNHAAVDGFGALQVLQAIARAYAGDPATGALDFLATRDLPVRPASSPTWLPVRRYKRAVERLRDLRDRPAPLAAEDPGDEPGSGVHQLALSAQETARVVGADRGRDNTNVLLAALHLAIGDWNRRHGVGGRRIGVLVHADLRPAGWRDPPIGNFTVTARMSPSRAERADAATALATITELVSRNKRTRTGIALIAALERANLLALWTKQSIVVLQPLTANHVVDTTVLCNLGRLDQAPSFGPAGDAQELWFSTPARAPLSLCLGAVTVGGRLHLTFRYPHRVLGPDAARRFADCYLTHLRRVAQARP